jgi:chemotaxis protein methyltransferase CheR
MLSSAQRGPVLTIEREALDGLAALLLDRVGLKITPDGYHGLKLALSSRMPALGIADAEEYVKRLNQLAGEHELRSLLPLVTVGKTDFFRDSKQFYSFESRILPEMLNGARLQGRRMLIWSAGCATGEEPYSLAISAIEANATPDEIDIFATDLNLAAVDFARIGRYPLRRMGGVSGQRLKRFFKNTDDGYEVMPKLRQYIRFDGQNLAAPVFPKIRDSSLDVILCRNVIIYFDLPTIRGLMDRFLQALRPGGLLLLGYSESLFKVYDRFEMVEVEGTFAYRRPLEKGNTFAVGVPVGIPTRPSPSGFFRALPQSTGPARKPSSRPASSSTERRAAGAAAEPPGASGSATPLNEVKPIDVVEVSQNSPALRLGRAIKSMELGDFSGALSAVKKLAEDQPNDLAALLTLGNIQSLMGMPNDARDTFALALSREPLCVEARVFGGVAALQAGQLQDARSELTKALFLEPTLAIGHYLQAQVAERQGDREGARRSYRNAIAQLRYPQRPLAGHYPDMPDSAEAISRAARYALAAVEEDAP